MAGYHGMLWQMNGRFFVNPPTPCRFGSSTRQHQAWDQESTLENPAGQRGARGGRAGIPGFAHSTAEKKNSKKNSRYCAKNKTHPPKSTKHATTKKTEKTPIFFALTREIRPPT